MTQAESIRSMVYIAAPSEFGKLRIPVVQESRIIAAREDPDDLCDGKSWIECWLPRHHPALTRVLNRESCVEQFLSAPTSPILVSRAISMEKLCSCHPPYFIGRSPFKHLDHCLSLSELDHLSPISEDTRTLSASDRFDTSV